MERRNLQEAKPPGLERRSIKESGAGIENFAAERVELMILIIVMAFMISIIDETFRLVMYLIIFLALLLTGYNYLKGTKSTTATRTVAQKLSPRFRFRKPE